MDLKTNTLLDKYVKEDKLHELKASEITKVRKEEHALGAVGCLFFGAVFLLVIAIVALIIWTNKFTLFLTIVVALGNVPTVGFALYQYKLTLNLVKEIAERVNNL